MFKQIDSTLSGSYYTKSETGTTLNLYSPSAQILSNFYSKLYIANAFLSSAQTGTLYYNKTETGNLLLSYSTGSYVDFNFDTKAETDTLLADKLINTGNIELPGWLDIGTSGYTNSRIRCNADVNGYTGYAELRAASSYGMYLNLSTTRTDGGWVYFKINNDSYMQLSGSDNKVNIYKDTTISGNSDVGSTGDSQIKIHGTGATTSDAEFKVSNGQNSVWDFQNPSNGNIWPSIKVKGIKFMDFSPIGNIVIMHKAIRTNGSLNIGLNQGGIPLSMSNVKTYFNHAGSSGYMMMEGRYRDQGFLHFETNYQYGEMFLTVRSIYFIRCSDYACNPYVQTFQPLTQSSDDRLKENEELIENVCETLSKLRPQLHDKKPDMENDGPTAWFKESGLIAQELYYDAPELRHLIHKGKPETDEEGNVIPLPEIPTSIDPKQDPDYSSWGNKSAPVNYRVNCIFG